jgi:putative ABC transport system permease protein
VALVVATDGSPATLTPSVRAAVAEVDPGLPLSRATPYEALLGDSEARTRLTARRLAAFALTALLLGCLGVYGVAAQAVRERTREIGVRMALGAGAGSIVSAVLGEGLLLTVPGVLVGLAGAAAATRLLEGMLVGVRALDPTVFLGVPLLLALAAVLALWLPARRATRIDPVQVLRRG